MTYYHGRVRMNGESAPLQHHNTQKRCIDGYKNACTGGSRLIQTRLDLIQIPGSLKQVMEHACLPLFPALNLMLNSKFIQIERLLLWFCLFRLSMTLLCILKGKKVSWSRNVIDHFWFLADSCPSCSVLKRELFQNLQSANVRKISQEFEGDSDSDV